MFWKFREELSRVDGLRRSYYELLRDQLDEIMLEYTLLDSFKRFKDSKIKYPFVSMREMKPRARIPDLEYECQNCALVIFVEDAIPDEHKKYIRFFDTNRATKKNLLRSKTLKLSGKFDRNQKYFESAQFQKFLKALLPVDYALLIQRDPATQTKDRYGLSHFHVRIDWPIAEAAEDMAQYLRYISKELYEKGDKYAEDIQKKFFEYYGLPAMAGGRRTAAIVAAQYLRRVPCITTVYAGSSESRSLFRLSERGISKTVLMRMTPKEMDEIASMHNLGPRVFRNNYQVARQGRKGVVIFQTAYHFTDHARPPDDGKLRDLKPDLNWLTVDAQLILPRPGVLKYSPLPIQAIYT